MVQLLERLPERVQAILEGDREALINLLLIAADVGWQSRADVMGTVASVASAAHAFADSVADCYSVGKPPSDEQCDEGFAMADRVDALAIEVQLRRRDAGVDDDVELGRVKNERVGVRYEARAHMTALRQAAIRGRPVQAEDVTAAEHLYALVVELTRQCTRRVVGDALSDLGPGASVTGIADAPTRGDPAVE